MPFAWQDVLKATDKCRNTSCLFFESDLPRDASIAKLLTFKIAMYRSYSFG